MTFHEAPAAVVFVASELGGGNIRAGLTKLAQRRERWWGRVADWLLNNRDELERVLGEMRLGLRPPLELVAEINKELAGSPV